MKRGFGMEDFPGEFIYFTRGKLMRVGYSGYESVGKFMGEDKDFLYLLPHLVVYSLPDGRGGKSEFAHIEEEIPKRIRKNLIVSYDPLVDWYMEELAARLNQEFQRGQLEQRVHLLDSRGDLIL